MHQSIAIVRPISFTMKQAHIAVLLLSAVGALNAYNAPPMTLKCNFQMEKHFWGEEYTCIGQDVNVINDETFITKVSGQHMPGKSDNDVRTVYFADQLTVFIPFNIGKFFHSLTALRIESSNLTYLNPEIFRNMRQLTHIHLMHNKIGLIPTRTFNGLSELVYLSLSGNKIRNIDSQLLIGLKNLRFFYIGDNEIEVVGSSLFKNNARLEEVIFANNRIRMIGTKLVVPIFDLKFARFDGNVCTNVDLRYVPNITFKLTSEFGQKCNVVCPSRSVNNSTNYELEELMRQNRNLNRLIMSDKLEKQMLRYHCDS